VKYNVAVLLTEKNLAQVELKIQTQAKKAQLYKQ
jgi:hypothetical protein